MSIPAKIYAKHLLLRLEDWVEDCSILTEVQSGFRPRRSTTDNVFILHHLIQSHIHKKRQLYTVFIDFRAAFDSVNRSLLWSKLNVLGVDNRLLQLLISLHSEITTTIRINTNGTQTNQIPLEQGVRQGCVLAPLLFNLFINDLPDKIKTPLGHAPKIGSAEVNALLYADDVVLFSQTKIGLKRMLINLISYCKDNTLELNISKSKILIFGTNKKKPNLDTNWKIGQNRFERVYSYRYLGVTFTHTGNWNLHVKKQNIIASSRIHTLNKLSYSYVPSTILPILKIYQAKIIPVITYGAEVWGIYKSENSETPQNKFLRSLLGIPASSQAAAARAETGLYAVESMILAKPIYYWLSLRRMPCLRLPRKCLEEQLKNPNSWAGKLLTLITKLGLADLQNTNPEEISKTMIRQRIRDHLIQKDLESVRNSYVHSWLAENKQIFRLEKYLDQIVPRNHRTLFTRARFSVLESELLHGRYNGIPLEQRTCICGVGVLEDTAHILIKCPLYDSFRNNLLGHQLQLMQYWTLEQQLTHLLSGSSRSLTGRVMKFLFKAKITREQFLATNAIDVCHDFSDL